MLSPGTMLGGRYRLDERIAGGGMGDVWRGTDEVLGRTVAVKVLLPSLVEEAGFTERFRGEARTMATINHPGVVDVYDYGSEGGTAFLIMEYVEGDALARTLGRVSRLTPARTMSLVAQAADALHAAHQRGIVHRDVKPGNLLVRPNGTLVLTDFGIARAAQAAHLTAVGSVLGTAAYISPEQASGQQATPLSDVYALGVVAYQCLAGRRPFEGDNPIEIAMRHVRDMPAPLPQDVPPAVAQIVDRAMAKDPVARWQSAAALAEAARTVAAQLSGGTAPVSPATGSTQAAGTTVVHGMPGAGVPGMPPGPGNPQAGTRVFSSPPGSPISGPPQGGYARGAAGVPMPASPPGTGYGLGGPAPVMDPAPGFGPDLGYPGRSPLRDRARDDSTNRTILIVATVVAVLIALVGVSLAGYKLFGDDETGDVTPTPTQTSQLPSPQTTKSARPSPSQTKTPANEVDVNCETLRGMDYQTVEQILTERGFEVVLKSTRGGKPNAVVSITPCRAPKGATITVTYSLGQGDPTPSGPSPRTSCVPLPNNPNSCTSARQP